MKIAVLSGKGGTGKTFVSVNLAYASENAIYVDCDVEEPNGWLFFKPQEIMLEKVSVMLPVVDKEKCSGCRKCVEFCKFNSLAYIKDKLLVFPELCHACRGCVMLCPEMALSEGRRDIGRIENGIAGKVKTRTGVLNTGEATGVPIIRKLLCDLPENEPVIIDCPPGSSCAVMESIRDADYCLMVAEPTVFGIHNLEMVYRLVKLFDKPYGVLINKAVDNEVLLAEFCKNNSISVLEKIQYDQELGLLNSNGSIAAKENAKYMALFKKLLNKITREVCHEATGCTQR